MKCPMQVGIRQSEGTNQFVGFFYCLKEECAWWDAPPARCAFLQLTMEIGSIRYILDEIAKKMPHADQFTK